MTVLIGAAELAAALAEPTPPVVLDARYPGPGARRTGLPAFEAGHIPGSVWIDVDTDLAGPHVGPGGRHPLPSAEHFSAAMRRAGVRRGSAVVVLDAANSLAAGRLWWLLTDAGHPDVRVLDGGFAAWQRAGGEVATGAVALPPEGDFVARPGGLPIVHADAVLDLLGRTDAVLDLLGRTDAVLDLGRTDAVLDLGRTNAVLDLGRTNATGTPQLWDVRAPERYRGEAEPIDPVAGHIPGARNLPATELFADDGTFLPAEDLRRKLAGTSAGDVLYCGSGLTAAQVLLAMTAAGVADGVRLYPGSWSDWISSGDRPIATG